MRPFMQNRTQTLEQESATEISPDQSFSAALESLIIDYFSIDIAETKLNIYHTRNTNTLFENRMKDSLTLLLGHIAKREQHQAEQIIKLRPELLFEPGNTQDSLANTYVNYTPVQLARYFHDTEMLKIMKTYLNQVSYGDERFVITLLEADEECKNYKPYNFKKLIDSLNFYDEENFLIESYRFKEYVKPKVIKNKKSFNMQDIFEAYAIYISTGKATSKYTTWDNHWDIEQRLFLLYEVINPLRNLLPLCYTHVPTNKKNMGQRDWDDLNKLYQTKMTELFQFSQFTLNTDKEHNKCSACSLM